MAYDSERLNELCRQLRAIIGSKAEALWQFYVSSPTPMAQFDAQNLIEAMALTHLGSGLKNQPILLPPDIGKANRGEINLGKILFNQMVLGRASVSRLDLTRHFGIFATTGSGKTNLGYHLCLQFIEKRIPFLVIDWKRSYRTLLAFSNTSQLTVFTVGRMARPFSWNPLRPPPGTDSRSWIVIVSEALEKSHVSGQGVADVLIDHFASLSQNRDESQGCLNFHDLRDRIEQMRYKGRRQLWQDSCLRILRSFTYGPAEATFNSRNPIKIESLLNRPVVLELDQEMPKPLRTFFSELILRWIHLYRLGQGETSRLRHVLVLEEVHNLFNRSTMDAQATGSLENVFREIRSFGQSLVTMTQHPSLLPIYLLGNTNILIFLSLTHESDIIAARQSLFLKRSEEVFLDRLAVGEGIIKVKGRIPSSHIRFPRIDLPLGKIKDEALPHAE